MPLPIDGEADWVSHVAHTGAKMACDLVLTRGACSVCEWSMGGNHNELLGGNWLSDHRPVKALLQVNSIYETAATTVHHGDRKEAPHDVS